MRNAVHLSAIALGLVILTACSGGDKQTENLSPNQQKKLQESIAMNTPAAIESHDTAIELFKEGATSRALRASETDFVMKYVARVPPISVDGHAVQANDIVIHCDRAYVAYNTMGPEYAGAIQIIDISNPQSPKVTSQVHFSRMEVNALHFNECTGELIFGGQADVEQLGFRSFISHIKPANLTPEAIVSNLKKLGSFAVTSIAKKGEQYFVGTGAKDGGIEVLDAKFNQVKVIQRDDIRDVDSYAGGVVALGGVADSSTAAPQMLLNVDSTLVKHDLPGPMQAYHKATLEIHNTPASLCQPAVSWAFLGLSEAGTQIVDLANGKAEKVFDLANPDAASNPDSLTNSVSFDDSFAFAALGGYGFRVIRVNGRDTDPKDGTQPFAELVGYHTLQGSVYGGNSYSANHIAYKNNHLFVASGESGVNIYRLVRKDQTYPIGANILPESVFDKLFPLTGKPPAAMFDPAVSPMLTFKKPAQVEVIFFNEFAGYKNNMGFFTASGESALLKEQLVWTNTSKILSGGCFKRGDTSLLGNFQAGEHLGLYIHSDGFNKPTNPKFYTLDSLNTSDANRRHVAAAYHAPSHCIVLGFEDLPKDSTNESYNDLIVVLRITSGQDEALGDLVDLSKLPDASKL